MKEFGFPPDTPTLLWCDNQSAIHISRNLVENQRTKHIEIHMYFIRHLIHDDSLILEYVPTSELVVDIFTKPFASPWYLQMHSIIGVNEVVLGGFH